MSMVRVECVSETLALSVNTLNIQAMPFAIQDIRFVRQKITELRAQGKSVGFVPTMGALHAGHLALIVAAKQSCDAVVASIFINPMQFSAGEDLEAYPKRIEQDSELLQEAGADILYLPSNDVMYPQGFATAVNVSGLSQILCGISRPHHFSGVTTVVTKLLMQVMPDEMFLGEKDYQQLTIIQRMVDDLNIPVAVTGVPTVRDADGLALSSRNLYLTESERKIAPALYQTLTQTAQKITSGDDVAQSLLWATGALVQRGFDKVDYLELRHADDLSGMTRYAAPARLLAAAYLGKTRLIDNIKVE